MRKMGEVEIIMITYLARYLTVFKKEGSTIVARDAVLELTEGSLRLIWSLLSRYARCKA